MRLALAALAALLLATPAAAKIVIGRSIHGVRATATEQRFRAVFGGPDNARDYGDDPADYGLTFRGGAYHGLFHSKTHRADLISTTSKKERTSTGIGPGVSARLARARLKGEHCASVYDEDRGIDTTQCAVRTGTTETDFNIAFGRVFEVVIDAGG